MKRTIIITAGLCMCWLSAPSYGQAYDYENAILGQSMEARVGVPLNQEVYLETRLQSRLSDPRLQFPKNSEKAHIGIVRKIGMGAAALALVAMGYFALLWFILQSCLFVFVRTKTHKKPASAK